MREGRGMKNTRDMMKVYENKSTMQLLILRSKKSNLLVSLMKWEGAYWARKEIARNEHYINQIDAVLAARALQEPTF